MLFYAFVILAVVAALLGFMVLILALVAALLGFVVLSGTLAMIAKILLFVFLVLFAISLVFGRRRRMVL